MKLCRKSLDVSDPESRGVCAETAGPDSGLYVKTIIENGPTWRANEEAVAHARRSPTIGMDSGVRVSCCPAASSPLGAGVA